jgi:adenylate cyclase, class 2
MTSTQGKIEYEARFMGVDLSKIRERLDQHPEITCDYPRTLLRRYILEDSSSTGRGYLRLRTGEFGKSFLTLKSATGSEGVDAFSEVTVEVGDEEATLSLFGHLGFKVLRYQENYREQWRWGKIIFDLDEWPGLPPFLEIEADDAGGVAEGARYLELSMDDAEFDNVSDTYRKHAGRDILAESRLVF